MVPLGKIERKCDKICSLTPCVIHPHSNEMITQEQINKIVKICITTAQVTIRDAVNDCSRVASEEVGGSPSVEEVTAAAMIGMIGGFAESYKICLDVDSTSLCSNRELAKVCVDVFNEAREVMVKEGMKFSFDKMVAE